MSDYRAKSFWLESLPEPIVPTPSLSESIKADVVIVGGGYTGLSTAYHLKKLRPSLHVRVLESHVCGYGASGRNAGFSMTLFGLTKAITKVRFGNEKARAAQVYMEEAVEYQSSFIREHRIDCDYEKNGYLLVAENPAQEKRLEHEFRIAESWGLQGVERWSRQRLQEEFKAERFLMGWFEPRCALLNPAKWVRGLKRAAEAAGAVIHENSPVADITRNRNGSYTASAGAGEVTSEYLVFATNAYSTLFPELRRLQTPAFTHVVLTEPIPAGQLEAVGWKSRAGIEDCRDLIHYYRLTPDNRLLMGGGDVSIGYGENFDQDYSDRIFRHLERHIAKIFPPLSGTRMTHRWGGPVSVTLDMAPAIGSLGRDRKALYSLGCVGHGVSMTLLNGLTLAELIVGVESPRTRIFFVGRGVLPWPPEPARYALSSLIRAFMRFEDRFIY